MQHLFLVAVLISQTRATSVAPVDHVCPICEQPVQLMVLQSYSKFGKQPRNLSASRIEMSAGICPYDLFCAYSYRWEKCIETEKKRLIPVLGKCIIELTPLEKSMLAKHGTSFFEPVKHLLWLRTCNQYRQKDSSRDFKLTLGLYYESYPKPLRDFYRQKTIDRLSRLPEEKWMNQEITKISYAYLRAELLREAGRLEESTLAFNRVLEKYKASTKQSDGNRWIADWSSEQLTRIVYTKMPSKELGLQVLPKLPMSKDNMRVSKKLIHHQIALEILVERMKNDDQTAGIALNKILGRKGELLLALLETVNVEHSTLTKNPNMRSWLVQIRAQLVQGKHPEWFTQKLQEEHARTLNRALGIIDPSFPSGDDSWAWSQILIPHFQKWRKDPSKPPLPQGWTWQQGLEGYDHLISHTYNENIAEKHDAMRAILRILPQIPNQPQKWSYDLTYSLTKIAAERDNLEKTIIEVLNKNWRGSFWRDCVAYLNNTYQAEDLAKKNILKTRISGELEYEIFLWRFFATAKEPVWKEHALTLLKGNKRVGSHIYSYLGEFFDAAMIQPLKNRILLIRKGKEKKGNEMYKYELNDPEDLIRNYHWNKLTYSS